MSNKHTGFIVGAYPCAPSFHQRDEAMEVDFLRRLADIPHIRGIEQPCLENLHPYGDDFLFTHLPDEWDIVVTAVMETMRRRGTESGFGLASEDKVQRDACLAYYRHLFERIQRTNDRFGWQKVIALEMQAAPLAGTRNVAVAEACFQDALQEILRWDWPCELILEHCDSFEGIAPRKGFLPLQNEINALTMINQQHEASVGLCINWARSVLENHTTSLPLAHVKEAQQAGLLKAVMFSGTTPDGAYGEWQDLHAPFAPFSGAKVACKESLMTVDAAADIFRQAPLNALSFAGIKLLEIDAQADVTHRISIIDDGIQALLLASGNSK